MMFALWMPTSCYFYPRPPRGGRLYELTDSYSNAEFLSTPSARRATVIAKDASREYAISIHALREEGDKRVWRSHADSWIFLSTPSARRATAKTEKNISAFVSL